MSFIFTSFISPQSSKIDSVCLNDDIVCSQIIHYDHDYRKWNYVISITNLSRDLNPLHSEFDGELLSTTLQKNISQLVSVFLQIFNLSLNNTYFIYTYIFFEDDRDSEIASFNYDLTHELLSHLFLMCTHVSTIRTRSLWGIAQLRLKDRHLMMSDKLTSLIVLDASLEIGKAFVNWSRSIVKKIS